MTTARDIIARNRPTITLGKLRTCVTWAAWKRWGVSIAASLAAAGIVIHEGPSVLAGIAGHQTIPRLVVDREAPNDGRKHYRWLAAPSIVLVALTGTGGGPAGHHFSILCDQASSSTGDSSQWQNGVFEWRARVNGAVPGTRISCTDPINGATRYLDADQHGANFNFVHFQAEEVIVECRYRNASGEWSSWTAHAGVTMTARDTGLYRYVDGARADNTGDGLSWATAKRDFNEGLTLLNSAGAGSTLYWRTCNSTSAVTTSVSNVLIEAENSSQICTCTANHEAVRGGSSTNGLVIRNGTFTATTNGQGKIYNSSTGTPQNICAIGCHFDGLNDVCSSSGSVNVRGISMINLVEDGVISSQCYFGNDTRGFLGFGLDIPLGSAANVGLGTAGEHTFRFGQTDSGEAGFHSFAFCLIGNEVAISKTPLRWYAAENLWVYRCDLSPRTSFGGFSPDPSTPTTDRFCVTINFDQCHFKRGTEAGGSSFIVEWNTGTSRAMFRNCFFDLVQMLYVPRENEGEDGQTHTSHDVAFVQCEFYNTAGQAINFKYVSMLVNPKRQTIHGCRFRGITASTNAYIWFYDITDLDGYSFRGNIFERVVGANLNIYRDKATNDYGTFAQYDALSITSDETRVDSMTLNATTREPDNGLTTAPAIAPFPYRSYYGSDLYDTDATTYASGVWLDPSAAGSYPAEIRRYFIPTRRGGIRLKAVI